MQNFGVTKKSIMVCYGIFWSGQLITNTRYMTGTFSHFIFYTVQCKNLYPDLPVFFFFLLVTLFSKILKLTYLCFLAIFFLSLLSILREHNIKRISYCSLWKFILLFVILQISSTNDCMPLILLTSLISPNYHHIPQPQEKINPLLYFFAEPHSLYSICSNPRQESCHLMTMFWNAHLQHRFALSQIAT